MLRFHSSFRRPSGPSLSRCFDWQAKDRKRTGVFDAPIYKVRRRTGLNYIASFPLRTDEVAASKWILRGVALLGSID